MTVADLLSEFDYELANTRRILEYVHKDKFAWKLHEKSTSLSRLANHLAAMSSIATSDDHLAATIPALTITRLALLRQRVMSHMFHHRGQLSVYGPSADEKL